MIRTALNFATAPIAEKRRQARLYSLAFRLLRWSAKLGHSSQMRLGRFIGRRIMQLDQKHSRIAAINIDMCFPVLSPRQQREMLLRHFENLGMGISEMALSWWAGEEKFNRLIEFKGREHVDKALQQGNGIIFVTAQFTTMDVLVRTVGQMTRVTGLYRPHHNTFVDQCISAYRERNLEKILLHEDLGSITNALGRNQAVLISHDADAGHRQVSFEPFFGETAATNTAVSRFARMTGAAVIPVYAIRRPGNNGYKIVFESALPGFPGGSSSTDSQRLNQLIERWIEAEPEQYDWSYPRFRQRPEGEPQFY